MAVRVLKVVNIYYGEVRIPTEMWLMITLSMFQTFHIFERNLKNNNQWVTKYLILLYHFLFTNQQVFYAQ